MKKIIARIGQYVKDVLNEMRKVSWPTRSELLSSTIIVIIVSVITALVVFVFDTVFSSLLGLILR